MREIENGLFEDENGNQYYEETVLRFRVYEKFVGENSRPDEDWRLKFSSTSLKGANECKQNQISGDAGEVWAKSFIYKVIDNGEETKVKSLAW
tara:strand:+ start:578 stop:856 length:279 start_codon:yes stop_codon:yes gene_type:complete